MITQYAGAVEVRELGRKVASLAAHDREIMNALEFLLTEVELLTPSISRILLPRVDYADDFHDIGAYTVDHQVVRVDHGFARPLYPPRAIEKRVLDKPFGTGLHRILDAKRGSQVTVGNIGDDL